MLHCRRDEAHVLQHLLTAIGTLSRLSHYDTVLRLTYLAQAGLNLVECLHHVVDFAILLRDDALERVYLLFILICLTLRFVRKIA